MNSGVSIRAWARCLIVAIALRALIAPGYMPGAGSWPVQLCPDGLNATAVAILFGDEHRHGHSSDAAPTNTDHPEWHLEHCALGAALGGAALPTAAWAILVPPRQNELSAPITRLDFSTSPRWVNARAPPAS